MKIKILFFFIFFFVFFALAYPLQAAGLTDLCNQIDPRYQGQCRSCVGKGGSTGYTWTAIGCIPNDLGLLLKDYVFTYGMGIAGGIVFLYLIYGSFQVLTSAGNAERVSQGKETIVSALSGLILIIFSIFLLRVIGVDILKIPGFK